MRATECLGVGLEVGVGINLTAIVSDNRTSGGMRSQELDKRLADNEQHREQLVQDLHKEEQRVIELERAAEGKVSETRRRY